MADWVKCRLALNIDKLVYINLDQVITMAATEQGIRITGANGEEITVAGVDPKRIIRQDRGSTTA